MRGNLPPEAEAPSINVESADSEFASAYLAFKSDILEPNQVTDFLARVVQPRLSALEGVQRADILGGREFAMRIWLDPTKLAAYGVTPTQVRTALGANNYLAALGQTKGSLVAVNLSADTDISTVEDFEQLVLRGEGDSVIRLGDVAEVELGSADNDTVVRALGEEAIFMGIFPLPNANTLDVMELVRADLADIQSTLPSGMTAEVAYDASEYIATSIFEVGKTMAETLAIVCIVIFLFLGNFRSVLIPIMAIPISLIGAVFLMQLFGFSINLLTLLAIVLSVGLVVDDAIVVVENVERHISEGKGRIEAAMLGARELVGPVIAMTATLVAVYLPIGLQGGLTGSLFREFAFTLAGAVTISGIVALTLSPMMSAALLREGDHDRGFTGRVNRTFDEIKRGYTRGLDATLRARPAVYVVWITISLLCIPMFIMSPKELAPTEDQGIIFGIIDASANSTIEAASGWSLKADETFRDIEETDFTFQLTNPQGGFGGMALADWSERDRTVFEIKNEVAGKLNEISGLSMFPVTPPALPGGGQFPVEFLLASTDEPEQILEYAQQLQGAAIQSGLFAFPPIIDTKIDKAESRLMIDRDRVADMGLTMQQVGADVGTLLGGQYVNRFNKDGRSYKVIPQAIRSDRLNPDQLEDLYVTGPDDEMVQLGSIAEHREPHGAARAEPLPAAERGEAVGRDHRDPGRGADLPGERGRRDRAGELLARLHRRVPAASARGQQVPARLHPGRRADLPDAGRAVQQLPRSARDPRGLGAARHVRRADLHVPEDAEPGAAVLDQLVHDHLEHLLPGGARDTDRPGGQERHPGGGVRQADAAEGPAQARRHPLGGQNTPTAHPHDHDGDRGRTLPAGARHRRGCRGAELDRPHARRRHGHRHDVHALRDPVGVHAAGTGSGREARRAAGRGRARRRHRAGRHGQRRTGRAGVARGPRNDGWRRAPRARPASAAVHRAGAQAPCGGAGRAARTVR